MTSPSTSEVWFYHLERSGLEAVLPDLVEKTLARGWRAVVRTTSEERLEQLDTLLWTTKDESFLAHGRADEPHAARQPVLLTLSADVPNKADVQFVLDGVALGEVSAFTRTILLFDGHNETAVQSARHMWKTLKTQELSLSYWKEKPSGGWEKAA